MQRSLSFRLQPTHRQADALVRQLDACRRLYNACLEQRTTAYRLGVKVPREFDQNVQIKEVRRGLPEYAAVPAGVLQAVPKRVQRAFENFFRKDAGFPRFKGRARFTSLTHLAPLAPHGHGTYRFEPGKLTLTKVGRLRHRLRTFPAWYDPATAVPKTCHVRLVAGRWHASVSFMVPESSVAKTPAPAASGVGLDAGLAHLWSDDAGNHVDNPRWFQRSMRRLRREQRSLARRQRGGAGRARQALLVARIHERVAAQRLDFYHQLTRTLARRYALVAVEDHLAGLGRSRLARAVHDAAWATLHRLLEYKLAEHGGRLVKVDPRGTSATCSRCGGTAEPGRDRIVRCQSDDGHVWDRDTNAARNILARARILVARGQVPPDGREVTPAETGVPLTTVQAVEVKVPVVEAGTEFI